jgi:hypothetical protein
MTTEKPQVKQIGTAIPKCVLTVLNQIYQVEKKLTKIKIPEASDLRRNINKMKDAFAEEGLPIHDVGGYSCHVCLTYQDPMGQAFKETRTDLEATIAGSSTENLEVVEVIRPIIRATLKGGDAGSSKIVQKGIVIVESRKEN